VSVALSRTCSLVDFPDCTTVATWQQRLAERAWEKWQEAHHVRTREQTRCLNYHGIPFEAPGPGAIYEYPEPINGAVYYLREVERALAAVWALGVVDHIDAPVLFLQRAQQVLRPHGLLFLTFAFWDCEGEDLAEGHRHRARIYDAGSWLKLIREARRIGLVPFGGHDWNYHGHMLGPDHSLASLVLVRR
jgi:SAM-dependent methyltransferase